MERLLDEISFEGPDLQPKDQMIDAATFRRCSLIPSRIKISVAIFFKTVLQHTVPARFETSGANTASRARPSINVIARAVRARYGSDVR